MGNVYDFVNLEVINDDTRELSITHSTLIYASHEVIQAPLDNIDYESFEEISHYKKDMTVGAVTGRIVDAGCLVTIMGWCARPMQKKVITIENSMSNRVSLINISIKYHYLGSLTTNNCSNV